MKGIRTATAFFMITGAACALLFTALENFLPALGMLVFCALSLGVYLSANNETEPETGGKQQQPQIEPVSRDTEHMRFCPTCGYLGSQHSGEHVPPCPRCGAKLYASDVSLSEFALLPEAKRKAMMRAWKAGRHR